MLENFAELLGILATIFGICMSLAYFPQVYKIYKRKSSADVSILTFSAFLVGLIVWLLYGISISNLPLIIANAVGVIGASAVIAVCLYYRK